MKTLYLILLFLFFFNGINYRYQKVNLVRNGGFDGEPSFIHWYSELGITSKTLGGNPGGYAWLNHEGLETDPDINQDVNGFEPGFKYVIIGDYKGGDNALVHYNNPGDTVFAVDIDKNEIALFTMPDPVSKWTIFKTYFTATDTTHILRFRAEINGTDGDIAIDNISIYKNKDP